MAETPNVMPQLHMPLQSGSDAVLRAMRRAYRREKYLAILDRVRAAMPDAAITTDIIVGFPGETERDFEDTLDLVRQARFAGAFTFQYSPRPGTPAAGMDGQVPAGGGRRALPAARRAGRGGVAGRERGVHRPRGRGAGGRGRGPQGRRHAPAVRPRPGQPPGALRPGRHRAAPGRPGHHDGDPGAPRITWSPTAARGRCGGPAGATPGRPARRGSPRPAAARRPGRGALGMPAVGRPA